jgi:hypothetical protein
MEKIEYYLQTEEGYLVLTSAEEFAQSIEPIKLKDYVKSTVEQQAEGTSG